MRSDLTSRYGSALARASSLVLVTVALAACSNDSTRLDEFLTASTQTSANQRHIIKTGSAAKQTYPGNVARGTSAGVAAAAPTIAVAARKLAPAVSRSALPSPQIAQTQLPLGKPPSAELRSHVDARLAKQSLNAANAANTVVAANTPPNTYSPPLAKGQIVLPPQSGNTNPLRMTGVDPITTSSTRAAPPVAKVVQNPVGWKNPKGSWITIKSGETLYNISRRYGVPVNAIMQANNIADARAVQHGQRIKIPTYSYDHSAPVSAPDSNPDTYASRASRGMQGQARGRVTVPKQRVSRVQARPVIAPALPVPQNTGTYTVQSGDTLYAIAKRHKVSVTAVRDANNMANNTVRLGQKLKIPAYGNRVIVADNVNKQQLTGAVPSNRPQTQNTKSVSGGAQQATIQQRSEEQVSNVAKTNANSFRWPVQGRIIAKFGEKRSTGVNDGIDISVPIGTPVKATENGTVIYSGSELEDFGKLILLSHDGGWVSAYAHASSALVRRGQKVKRGQVIAKSGNTGNATAPKLHFELRRNSNPVNPLRHLSK